MNAHITVHKTQVQVPSLHVQEEKLHVTESSAAGQLVSQYICIYLYPLILPFPSPLLSLASKLILVVRELWLSIGIFACLKSQVTIQALHILK